MPSKSSKARQTANSRSKPSPVPQTLPIQNPPTTSSPEVNKKKKKKKTKAKATPVVPESRVGLNYEEEEEEEEEDDDIPPLEPAPGLYRSLTGLPPELEAVHLSATASLSATVAAAARNNPTAAAHAELIAAADDLCRRMDADPQGGIATDDDYWKSLPEHIRNFAQAMYAIAQQMVQSSGGKGPTKSTPGYPPGAFPASNLPFDQSILSRSPFNALMEQAVAPYLPTSNSPPSSRVYYSEDEQDCDEEDGEEEIIAKDERVSNSSLTSQPPPPPSPSQHTPRPPEKVSGVKTSGNSNSTNVNSGGGGGGGQPPELAALPALAGTAPRHSPAPVSVTTNAAMPPTSRVPPPSSRAAGKQPMNYASQPTNPNPPTTATRSARAASKQPLSAANYPHNPSHHHPSPPSSNASGPHKSRQNGPANAQSAKNNKIWSTSSTEERERIKEFWLGLGEEERRNLVKVEKEAVLKKMKEQQKHSCSCAVCGRKRNAIEDELEVLYDAYYEELEQYANYQQRYVSSGGTLPPPPGPGPFPGSVELDKNGAVVGHHKLQPPSSHPNLRSKNPPITAVPNGRGPKAQVKHPESEFEDDQDEDEYEEDDEYEAEEDDEEDEDEDDGDGDGEDGNGRPPRVTSRRAGAPASTRRRTAADAKPERDKLFSFGSSLTVTGIDNILTVADDLLKNDGQKFLEMMEQLADRRMIREDRATASIEDDSEEDEGDDEGDDDEDDEDDEEEEEEEEEEPMTEDQKVEEGKKMFSIFAARMFEQRVLQAYREQVAQERQLQLLRELEDEDKATKEKEAKKQTQNQKKKDKKKLQKLAKEGEKAAKAAEKAAEDALLKAKQQALEEEQKKKREEERAKREAARKAQEEEKQRRDEERRKRQVEEKERQAEQDRKRREREEKLKQERREKEERDRKAKEEREAKERAAAAARREQQEKEEREKKAREEERAESERIEKEKVEKEKEKETRAAQQSRKQNPRPPPSPRNATASSSTQRPPQPQTTPKKILNKPGSTNVVSPTPVFRQNSQPRPVIVTNQPIPQTPSQASNPPTPGYSPGVNGTLAQQNPLVSPRVPFNPAQQFNGFVPGPAISQQGPGPILGPSALPRNFGTPGFDSSYPARPIGTPAVVSPGPIGPPQKTNSNPPPPSMLAPGSGRRQSIIADPGPIGPPRLIQPIARPTEQSGSGSASPVRRSPSPKVLGSSALATEDDEVVQTSRRTMVNGPVWGAAPVPPRPSVDLRGPWGPPPPGFPIQPPNLSRPPVAVGPSPWGTANPNDQWHPSNFFPPGQFVGHTPSPPPHPGN